MNHQKAYQGEASLLGCILSNPVLIEEIVGEILVEDFYAPFHRRVYSTMLDMTVEKKKIDIITLADCFKKEHLETDSDIFSKLADLANGTFSTQNIKSYAEIIKIQSTHRRTNELLNEVSQKIINGDEDYLEYLKLGMTRIENNVPCVINSYIDLVNRTVEQLEIDSQRSEELTGLATGLTDLDHYTNGFQNGDLIVLAARPSMGKTMLMLNMADNAAIYHQVPVIVFSFEMHERQICTRSLSRMSKVKGDVFLKSNPTDEDWVKIRKGVEVLRKSKIFINDRSRLSIFEMRAYARKIKNQHGLKAIFIDYIELIQGQGETETVRLANISRDLKAMARDFNIPVIVLCQLNRNIENRPDPTPRLSDIRQCGNIEQDADIILFLNKKEKMDSEGIIHIAKHRNGRIGDVKVSVCMETYEFRNYYGV